MKKRYSSLMKMFLSVKVTIAKFVAEWTGLAAFEEVNTRFNDDTDEIEVNLQIRNEALKGYTAEKQEKRLAMCTQVVSVAKRIKAYAKNKRDLPLLEKMKKVIMHRLMNVKITESMLFVKSVTDAVKDMTAADKLKYGITPAQENLMKDAIAALEAVMTIPRDKVVVRMNATAKLKTLFKETEDLLIDEMDNIMMNFEGTDFFTEYKDARRILEEIRHTSILGNVTNPAGVDLAKVKVKITGKDKQTGEEITVFEEMTNKDGNFAKRALNPELSYDLEFITPDFEPKKISDIDLERGVIDRLEVQLIPKV